MTHVANPISRTFSGEATSLALLCALGLGSVLITGIAARSYANINWSLFVSLLILSGLLAVVATKVATRLPAGLGLLVVFGFALAMRAVAIGEPPILSDDIYRYIWDGRVQAAGINPYRYVPADPALASLRDTAIYPNINRVDYAVTVYPPAAQFFFTAITRLSESTLAMRLALIGCEIVTVLALIDLLRAFDKPLTLVTAYAWHPLTFWEIANSGHVDALMTALVMTGVWLLVRHRRLAAGLAIALAALVKPYAIVALPACWRPWDWRLPAAVIALAAACYLPYLGAGSSVFGFLTGYVAEEGLRSGGGFWLVRALRELFGDIPGLLPLYLVLAAATLGFLALRAAFRPQTSPEQAVRDIAMLLMTTLFFLTPNYAWYYLVIVPFIPIGGGAPAWVMSIGAFGLYLLYPDYDTRALVFKGLISAAFLIAVLATRVEWPLRMRRGIPWKR